MYYWPAPRGAYVVVGPAQPSLRGATCGGRALRLRRAPARCNALQPRETRGPAIPCAPLQHPFDLCCLSSQASLRCSQLPRTTRPSARAANHRSEAAFETHFLRVLLATSSQSASLLQASSTTVSRTTPSAPRNNMAIATPVRGAPDRALRDCRERYRVGA